jgi:ubiquinone/menaquinone biosynthesis C-methylase UbiE
MSINFHDEKNSKSYASRSADNSWSKKINTIVNLQGKEALDLGCGGGIYTRKLAELGASHVTACDFSEQMLADARVYCEGLENITFHKGDAYNTGLASNQFDVILERAVIHHLNDLKQNFDELYRMLKSGGLCIIQDRTITDCFLPGSTNHIRGYFFECFPKLKDKESARRPTSEEVRDGLQKSGFTNVEEHKLWETRKTYDNIEELKEDLLNRTGRSILHELSDEELKDLIDFIVKRVEHQDKIIEQDQWSIWIAYK